MKRVGIIATSSVVPKIEFELGVQKLNSLGYSLKINSQVFKRKLYLAGTDQEKSQALYKMACDPDIDIIWCACGGYGAARILPFLEKLTLNEGAPKTPKVFVGFSDVTALFEYVRVRWGFKVVHGFMVSQKNLVTLSGKPLKNLMTLAGGELPPDQFSKKKYKFLNSPSGFSEVRGQVTGGNLSTWASLIGTPFFTSLKDKVLFLEDVNEDPYKLDRYFSHALNAGVLNGVRAIVLGEFTDCVDKPAYYLRSMPKAANLKRALNAPKKSELGLLRPLIGLNPSLKFLFGEVGKKLGIPIMYGLPIGHGPGQAWLPMGAEVSLKSSGAFEVVRW